MCIANLCLNKFILLLHKISYNLHLHDFPETFKGHKMGRLQQYFGSPDCGHRCHLSSACLHNPLMYSTNMQQIQNASAYKYLLSSGNKYKEKPLVTNFALVLHFHLTEIYQSPENCCTIFLFCLAST